MATPTISDNAIRRYGRRWAPLHKLAAGVGATLPKALCDKLDPKVYRRWSIFFIEVIAISRGENEPWFQGRAVHYKALISLIWGRDECRTKFLWTPLAERMLEGVCQYKYVALAGHASSGKTAFGSIWAIISFIVRPESTKVFVTSTTLEESRQRIWGDIEKYWNEFVIFMGGEDDPNLSLVPGKLVSSRGFIRGYVNGKPSQLVGISLLPGGKGQDKKSSTKIGFKAENLVIVADELPLLTTEFYSATLGNLSSNPRVQFIGIGNLDSGLDPFGLFAEPRDGWSSVNEFTYEWPMKPENSACLRFDGLKSPNVLAGREIWPRLLTLQQVTDYKKDLGEDSPDFWRMVRSYISPTGARDCIYSEQMFEANGARMRVDSWIGVPQKVAFLDPSFAHGGDRAAAAFAWFGRFRNALFDREMHVMEIIKVEDLAKLVKVTDKTRDRNTQLRDLFHERCQQEQATIVGVDSTGGGDPFASLMAVKFGNDVVKVSFAGAPSDRPISQTDKRRGKERFTNRVSELWGVGRDYIRAGQVRGVTTDVIRELCSRTYVNRGERMEVEPKEKMKLRTGGKSPDLADAVLGALDICRQKFGFQCGEKSAATSRPKVSSRDPEIDRFLPRKTGRPVIMPALQFQGMVSWQAR